MYTYTAKHLKLHRFFNDRLPEIARYFFESHPHLHRQQETILLGVCKAMNHLAEDYFVRRTPLVFVDLKTGREFQFNIEATIRLAMSEVESVFLGGTSFVIEGTLSVPVIREQDRFKDLCAQHGIVFEDKKEHTVPIMLLTLWHLAQQLREKKLGIIWSPRVLICVDPTVRYSRPICAICD